MGLWTPEHGRTLLPALAVMFILAAVLRRWLGGKSMRMRIIPLQIIAVLLVVLEIGKQAVSLSRGYDLYHLPFHFCSLFIFALPVMAFYRGKHAAAVYDVVAAWCASLFLLMLIYPNLIYGAWDVQCFFKEYMCFHTVSFHNLVMLAAVLIPALRLQEQGCRNHRHVLAATCVFCAVSATMAQLLKTNYASFYSCNIPAFETARIALQGTIGPVLTQMLYVLIVAVLTVLFVWMSYGILCALQRLGTRGKQQTAAF